MKTYKIIMYVVLFCLFHYMLKAQEASIDEIKPKNLSSNRQLKNFLLEEFTGFNCTYCADGHRIAREMQERYGRRLTVVNIHYGGYSIPRTGERDFRVPEGSSIASLIQNGSYSMSFPSGSVSRYTNAISRGSWENILQNKLEDSAVVNIGGMVYVDSTTREMLVEVEIFYTNKPDGEKNYLNLYLLQDSIVYGQVNWVYYNPTQSTTGDASGEYINMHMLKDLLCDVEGYDLGEIDSLMYKRLYFRKTIPEQYNGWNLSYTKPTDFIIRQGHIELVAFVCSDGNTAVQDVISLPISFGEIPLLETDAISVRLLDFKQEAEPGGTEETGGSEDSGDDETGDGGDDNPTSGDDDPTEQDPSSPDAPKDSVLGAECLKSILDIEVYGFRDKIVIETFDAKSIGDRVYIYDQNLKLLKTFKLKSSREEVFMQRKALYFVCLENKNRAYKIILQ